MLVLHPPMHWRPAFPFKEKSKAGRRMKLRRQRLHFDSGTGPQTDRLDPMMLATAGQCFAWFGRDLAKGIDYIDEALAINPNLAHAFMQSGLLRRRAQQVICGEHLHRARRLSPRDSRNYAIYHGLAFAYRMQGDIDAALDWARRAAQHNDNYLPAWREYCGSIRN